MKTSTAIPSTSVRIPHELKKWVTEQSSALGTTNADIIIRSLKNQQANTSQLADLPKYVSGGSIKAHKITQPPFEITDLLIQLGAGTTMGFIGYHISGMVREQMKLDEDKGTQMLIGVGVGLLGMIGTAYLMDKDKK
jgi:hypothetical protein